VTGRLLAEVIERRLADSPGDGEGPGSDDSGAPAQLQLEHLLCEPAAAEAGEKPCAQGTDELGPKLSPVARAAQPMGDLHHQRRLHAGRSEPAGHRHRHRVGGGCGSGPGQDDLGADQLRVARIAAQSVGHLRQRLVEQIPEPLGAVVGRCDALLRAGKVQRQIQRRLAPDGGEHAPLRKQRAAECLRYAGAAQILIAAVEGIGLRVSVLRAVAVMQARLGDDDGQLPTVPPSVGDDVHQLADVEVVHADHDQQQVRLLACRLQVAGGILIDTVRQATGIEKAQHRLPDRVRIETALPGHGPIAAAHLVACLAGDLGDDAGLTGLGLAQQPKHRGLGIDLVAHGFRIWGLAHRMTIRRGQRRFRPEGFPVGHYGDGK
jgi:hypothetical protein